MDDRLAIDITHADGTHDRWGPDEPDGHDVPNDLQFSTSIPGGFKDMSCSLSRDLNVYADEALFDDVFIYGPGDDCAWEGRMSHFPRDVQSVTPTAVGYVSHLQDDTTAREIYIDCDMTQWGDSSARRKINLNNVPFALGSSSVVTDPTLFQPAVNTKVTGVWAQAIVAEAWYNSRGIPIKYLWYAWERLANIASADANWSWQTVLSDYDDHVVGHWDLSGNLRAAGPGYGLLSATTTTRLFITLQMEYAVGPAGGEQTDYDIFWTNTSVIGNHGMTVQGAWSYTPGTAGFYAGDIIANIVKRWAPLLNFTSPGSIEATTFLIPHFVQYDATTPYDMLSKANAFELKDWGVYRGGEDGYGPRTFFLREPSSKRLTWRARRSDGAVLTDEGIQAEQVVNGVVVNYTLPDGSTHTVGPPGTGLEATDVSLADTDPTNPVNAHGIPRRYGVLTLSYPTTLVGAIQVGSIWLSRRGGIQRRGTLTIVGKVKHPSGMYYPAWRVRAGDYVVVEDDPRDTTPRKIINTQYSHSNRSVMCDLEHDAFRIDAMMEQFAAVVSQSVIQ